MEPGTASIKAGTGRITTRRPPSPVRFDPRLFPQIVDGERVYFSRINGHPDQAADVVSAAAIAPLVARAGATQRFTRTAHGLLKERAADFVVALAHAPTPPAVAKFLGQAEAAMDSVAQLKPEGNIRVGVRAVREAIEAVVPADGLAG